MDYEKVKELMSAGFQAQEIREMLSNTADVDKPLNTPQKTQDNPQEEKKDEQSNQPESSKTSENTNNGESSSSEMFGKLESKVENLSTTMDKLLKAIQENNLNNSSFNKPNETDIDKQVDDIMASIIRPEHKKKEA